MLPLTLPRTTTDWALMLPLTIALSPRFNTPSVLISPSNFPSNVSSPENLRLPLDLDVGGQHIFLRIRTHIWFHDYAFVFYK